ncbi:hypothetical protein [Streptomyces sp. NPDC001269]
MSVRTDAKDQQEAVAAPYFQSAEFRDVVSDVGTWFPAGDGA